MQLEPSLRRERLTAATLTLLGAVAGTAHATDLTVDAATLYYAEGGGRVTAIEPVIKGTLDFGDRRVLTGKAVFDTLSGASPNGATPSSRPQTFTGASSGSKPYTTPAFKLPLDPNFRDTRVQGSLDYQFPTSEKGLLGAGVIGSVEHDYLSLGANTRYSYDLNGGNTTLSSGLGFEFDSINPIGGTHVPLSTRARSGSGVDDDNTGGKSDTKTVADLLLGVTQVLDAQSLLQFNYSLSQSNGYQNDPYKFLSVVGTDGEPTDYVYESRPGSRTKHALFLRYKRFVFGRDVVDLSARYLTDSWGISSQTADFAYRWYFGDAHYIEPHLRYYTQTAADFYRVALYTGEEQQLSNASSDYRLGAFDAVTVGVKLGRGTGESGRWSVRAEYYQQSSKVTGVPDQAAQGLSKFNLKSGDLSAVMLTVGYQFKW